MVVCLTQESFSACWLNQTILVYNVIVDVCAFYHELLIRTLDSFLLLFSDVSLAIVISPEP